MKKNGLLHFRERQPLPCPALLKLRLPKTGTCCAAASRRSAPSFHFAPPRACSSSFSGYRGAWWRRSSLFSLAGATNRALAPPALGGYPRQSRCSFCTSTNPIPTTGGEDLPKKLRGEEHIHISQEEAEVFRFLRDVVHAYSLPTTLRVAGGWVRDKLLAGKAAPPQRQQEGCGDLDIALSGMTGIEFCEYVVKYQEQRGIKASRVGLIKANPEQSKHLETAVMSIFGHPIEFVNLRVEEYNPDCRIPQMKLGNEKEDVKRRDFTINALFYNIHDDNVEDWTGMGLDDLQNKVLRTPIAPLDTMLEDPLRVLRAIRFVASFDLSLDPALDSALSDPNVKKALSSKVSRERFGIELNKMWSLNKQKTMQALEHIFRLNLHDVVWLVDDSSFSSTSSSSLQPSLWSSRMKDWSLRMTRGMHKLLSEDERIQKKQTGLQPIYHWTFKEKTQHDLAYLTAVLSPFLFTASLVETPPSKKRVKRMQQNIMNILRSSLSLSNAQIGSVIGIVDATYKLLPIIAQEQLEQAFVDDRADALVDNIHNQVPLDHSYFKQKHQQHQLDEVKSQFQEQQQRKAYATFVQNNTGELGMWLRECSLHPSNSQLCWLVSAYLADLVINLLTPLQQTEGELKDEIDGRVGTHIPFQAPLLIEAIVQSSLVSVLQMDPFLNGEDIMKELNIAAGPAVGEFTSRLVQWQITQGTNATKEQAITYLQFLHRKRQE